METPSRAKYKPVFTGLNQEQRHFQQKELIEKLSLKTGFFMGVHVFC